eukprot:TRINITY_DN42062_c0_g1_i1.p1 TRINITY_DN42062_c0_g1~~TRINITY_DN42062_c0_g1_i1.p1  ORF type:complete len:891 (-),score=112.60 TRINITY_DN42062_c0_g1_i1:27-2549(-)
MFVCLSYLFAFSLSFSDETRNEVATAAGENGGGEDGPKWEPGSFVKLINGRCSEVVGALPLGGPDANWTRGIDDDARLWCSERDWCVGYMRYMGDDATHCKAWCGRPQFCNGLDLVADDTWISYVKADAFFSASPERHTQASPSSNGSVEMPETPKTPEGSNTDSELVERPNHTKALPGHLEHLPSGPELLRCRFPYEGYLMLWYSDPDAEMVQENKGSEEAEEGKRGGHEEVCTVQFHVRGAALPAALRNDSSRGPVHGILSENEEVIPFFTANTVGGTLEIGREQPAGSTLPFLFAFDANEYIGQTLRDGGNAFGPKLHYLSFFFLSSTSACDGRKPRQWGPDAVRRLMPDDVFVDDGTEEIRRKAFSPYHFSIICGDAEEDSVVPQAMVDAIGFAAHPLVHKKVHSRLTRVFFHAMDAVQPFSKIHPIQLLKYVEDLYMDPSKNEAMHYKQTFLFLMQDLLSYRYGTHFRLRLRTAACSLCTERIRRRRLSDAAAVLVASGTQTISGAVESASLAATSGGDATGSSTVSAAAVGVAICVMSRRSGHELRAAIRETWATKLIGRGTVRFFVGVAADADDEVADIQSGDVVELAAPETYKAVTLKAFSMLDWAFHAFPNLRFLIRADDDVYLRPWPLLAQLDRRPPVMYLWGNIDHGSNPVRDVDHPHYNSFEQMPKQNHPLHGDIFPPYARGHLWAMSADLVSMVAQLWQNELDQHDGNVSMELAARLPHPDDPALGVALSRLVSEDNMSLNIDDRDLNVFALNPSCNATYLMIHSRTWVVHHVDSKTMRCMWAIDNSTVFDEESGQMPDICSCSMEVVEEEDDHELPFAYPKTRFNE